MKPIATRLLGAGALALLLAPSPFAQDKAERVPFHATPTTLLAPATPAPAASPSLGGAILAEDFDDTAVGALPAGWTEMSTGADGVANWSVYLDTNTGNNAVRSRDQSGGAREDFLVTPQVTLDAGETALSFDAKQRYSSNYSSVYSIRVSTTVPDDMAAFTEIASFDETDFPGLFSTFSVDLSAYGNQSIYVAFVHEQNFGDQWLMDNVVIDAPQPASFASTSTFFQFSGEREQGGKYAALVASVSVDGSAGTVQATSITFTTAGSTDPANDAFSAEVYYTGSGTSIDVDSDPTFGSAVAAPNGTLTFTDSFDLPPGPNYFWLVYELSEDGTPGNDLDATFESVTVDGSAYAPATTSLDGALQVGPRMDYVTAGDNSATGTTFARPGSVTSCDVSTTATTYPYETADIQVTETGVYDILATWDGYDGYLLLYEDTFDPSSPCTNLIALSDDGATTATSFIDDVVLEVPPGGRLPGDYILVMSTFNATSPGGSYTLEVFKYSLTAEVLPVEMTAFAPRVDGDAVVLEWATASETNNAGFDVQVRRPGADAFETVAFVDGHGTTTEARSYAFRVGGLQAGTHRFRLRQVDLDGQATLTSEVEAAVEIAQPFALSAARPNPFAQATRFELAVQQQQDVRVAVYDVLGREVVRLHDGPFEAQASRLFELSADQMAAGTYVVRVQGERFAETMRVTVVR